MWSNAANWLGGVIPAAGDKVGVPTDAGVVSEIAAPLIVDSVNVSGEGTLLVNTASQTADALTTGSLVNAATAIDVGAGDAEIVVDDSSNFSGELYDFGVGDSLEFLDLDPADIQSVTFIQLNADQALLQIDLGFDFVDVNLTDSDGFVGVSEANFIVDGGNNGGLALTFDEFGVL